MSDILVCFQLKNIRALGMNFVQATKTLKLRASIPPREIELNSASVLDISAAVPVLDE